MVNTLGLAAGAHAHPGLPDGHRAHPERERRRPDDADGGRGAALNLELNGYRAHVEEFGSGSPVVLVHGLGGTGAEHLEAPDRRSGGGVPGDRLRPARLGSERGHARARTRSTCSPTTCARSSTRSDSGESRSSATRWAARSPSRTPRGYPGDVSRLVGIGAPAELPDQARAGLAARAETVEAEGMARGRRDGRDERRLTDLPRGTSPSEFRELIAMLAANDPHGYAAQCRALVGLDLADRLGRDRGARAV